MMRSIARRRTPGNRRNRPRLMVIRLGDPSHPSSTHSSASIGGTSHPASSATLDLTLAGTNAGNVHPLLGFRRCAADDHVFYFFFIELRDAVQRALDGHSGKVVRPRGAQ